MDLSAHRHTRPVDRPSFVELFTPKLITVLREGYGLKQLRADAIAGGDRHRFGNNA
jgi:hypothetical protein